MVLIPPFAVACVFVCLCVCRDPSFYEHLQKSDKQLLEFDADADEAMTGADREGEDDEDGDTAMGDDDQPKKKLTKKEKKKLAKAKAEAAGVDSKDDASAPAVQQKKTKGQKERERAAKGLDTATLKALTLHIVERKSLTALRRMLALFRQACHLADEDDKRMSL